MMSKTNPLYVKSDLFVKEVYKILPLFPKYEIYALTSQLRRSSMSVILNIVEGFARQSPNEYRRFLIIAFGSLEESRYIIGFSKEQSYISDEMYRSLEGLCEEIAKLLWTTINQIKN